MNAPRLTHLQTAAARQRGFTLVELMVTVAIALFLLYGLVTTVQNVRQTSFNQQALTQLQDEQRFAMTVLTDVIQAGGYFPDATLYTLNNALPTEAAAGSALAFGQAQPFNGTTNGAAGDIIGVRYLAPPPAPGAPDVLNCQGGANTSGNYVVYANTFSVSGGQLVCSVNTDIGGTVVAGPQVPLVSGVTNLQILFGVKRNFALVDYNVDTYVTPANMSNTDWDNISSVRVSLTFTNPLYKGPGYGQPATITFDRVVEVMAHAGNYIS
jgi:type IV pilus assembly protein PilW